MLQTLHAIAVIIETFWVLALLILAIAMYLETRRQESRIKRLYRQLFGDDK